MMNTVMMNVSTVLTIETEYVIHLSIPNNLNNNISLKSSGGGDFVDGADFDRNYVDFVLAKGFVDLADVAETVSL